VGVNKKCIFPSETRGLALKKCSQPKGVKQKMREGKSVRGVKLAQGFKAKRA
jgi:hypothetical protein